MVFLQDQYYARENGISVDEAVRRRELQEGSHAVRDQLRALAPDRLSATWIEHSADMTVVAWYTGAVDSLPDASHIRATAPMPMPIEIRGGAPGTLAELQARASLVAKSVHPSDVAEGVWLDHELAVVVVDVSADVQDPEVLRVAQSLPDVGLEISFRRVGRGANHVGGGIELNRYSGGLTQIECTTGFTVTDSSATGVITAEHCPEPLTYGVYYDSTQIVVGINNPYYDVQWRSVIGTEVDEFYGGSAGWIEQTNQVDRVNMLNDYVCRYGKKSNVFACAYIESITHAPLWDNA